MTSGSGNRKFSHSQEIQNLHPAERWVVLAHAVAFGSAYVLSATSASFLLVLAVHHEVQYLYFTYAMARWRMAAHKQENPKIGNRQSEIRFAASFALWPLIGLPERSVPVGVARLVRPARSWRTFLPLLARWADLDTKGDVRPMRRLLIAFLLE